MLIIYLKYNSNSTKIWLHEYLVEVMFSLTSNLTTGEENTYPPEKYVKLMFNFHVLDCIACIYPELLCDRNVFYVGIPRDSYCCNVE